MEALLLFKVDTKYSHTDGLLFRCLRRFKGLIMQVLVPVAANIPTVQSAPAVATNPPIAAAQPTRPKQPAVAPAATQVAPACSTHCACGGGPAA